jgi:hypothetical protein
MNAEPAPTPRSQAIHHLDLKNNSVSEPVDRAGGEPDDYRFVRVEIVGVVNAKMHPAVFQVHYEAASGERTFLGTFTLFPSDNPGNFIVPAKGKLRSDGRLVLTLVVPDDAEPGDVLQVDVKPMSLTKD